MIYGILFSGLARTVLPSSSRESSHCLLPACKHPSYEPVTAFLVDTPTVIIDRSPPSARTFKGFMAKKFWAIGAILAS